MKKVQFKKPNSNFYSFYNFLCFCTKSLHFSKIPQNAENVLPKLFSGVNKNRNVKVKIFRPRKSIFYSQNV